MKVVVQRVKQASVSIDGETTGRIGQGLVVLVGFTSTDTLETIEQLAKKIVQLRIFDDANGVMNVSLLDGGHAILSISQFTLYADTKKATDPVTALLRQANKQSTCINALIKHWRSTARWKRVALVLTCKCH
jgi:D-tyrosyl-tRNA(Tyr) deacylase